MNKSPQVSSAENYILSLTRAGDIATGHIRGAPSDATMEELCTECHGAGKLRERVTVHDRTGRCLAGGYNFISCYVCDGRGQSFAQQAAYRERAAWRINKINGYLGGGEYQPQLDPDYEKKKASQQQFESEQRAMYAGGAA